MYMLYRIEYCIRIKLDPVWNWPVWVFSGLILELGVFVLCFISPQLHVFMSLALEALSLSVVYSFQLPGQHGSGWFRVKARFK